MVRMVGNQLTSPNSIGNERLSSKSDQEQLSTLFLIF
jgi:hypothetical protein